MAKQAPKTAAPNAPNVLSIEVSLAPPQNSGILSTFGSVVRPRAFNSSLFHADSAQIERARHELQTVGFRIVSVSRTSISVEGTASLFESVFGSTPVATKVKALGENVPNAKAFANSYVFPKKDTPWSPPKSLAGIVERAYIQPPYLYFGSPLPPRITTHHLRIPGDVAMLTGATEVHRQGTTGKGVTVAMIDSGFDIRHPYYLANGYNMQAMAAPDASDPEQDDNGHGSAEAANILAIAPDVNFVGIKSGASLPVAFKEAVKQNPSVISVSLGFDLRDPDTDLPTSTLPNRLRALEAEISDAVASGITVVFSAGNGHISFPGMHPDVISAGGVFVDEQMNPQASDYASAFASLVYPGRLVPDLCGLVGMQPHAAYIMLPLPDGCEIDTSAAASGDGTQRNDGWAVISGTSAAAPQLAGVCALLKQKNPGLTPADVKALLRRTARDVSQGASNGMSNPVVSNGNVIPQPIPAAGGPDGATGSGLVDAFAAWKQA